MISERTLSSAFPSFWSDLVPFSESFTRLLNGRVTRFNPSIVGGRADERSDVIRGIEAAIQQMANNPEYLADNAQGRLNRIYEYAARKTELRDSPTNVVYIKKLIGSYLKIGEAGKEVTWFPRFPGMHIISACRADLLKDNVLFEFKSVSRSFRAQDLRQLIVYLVLNRASGIYDIDSIVLANPLQGMMFRSNVDSLIMELAGEPFESFFDRFIGRLEAIAGEDGVQQF